MKLWTVKVVSNVFATFVSSRKDDPSSRQNVTICRKLKNGDIRSVHLWINVKVTVIKLLSCKSFVGHIEFSSFIVNVLFPQTTLIIIRIIVYIMTYFIVKQYNKSWYFGWVNNQSLLHSQKKLAKLLNLCSVFPNLLCWTLQSFTFLNFSPSQIIREVAKKVAQIQNGKSTLPLFVSISVFKEQGCLGSILGDTEKSCPGLQVSNTRCPLNSYFDIAAKLILWSGYKRQWFFWQTKRQRYCTWNFVSCQI